MSQNQFFLTQKFNKAINNCSIIRTRGGFFEKNYRFRLFICNKQMHDASAMFHIGRTSGLNVLVS